MPRPKKFRTDNALECPHCFKMCKSESGLTRHCNSLHSHYSEGSDIFLENTIDISFQSLDPSEPPDSVGVPPDIMDALPFLNSLSDNPPSPLSEFLLEIPEELSDDFQYDSEDDADSDHHKTVMEAPM